MHGVPSRSLLEKFADFIVQFVPDAISASIILIAVLTGAALALGNEPAALGEAFYKSLWSLLPFVSQIVLILVLSGALALSSGFRRTVARLSELPRTRNQFITLAVLLVACCSYGSWALSTTLGPLIAVLFARAAEKKGIGLHFPALLATTFCSGAVWQYGFSATTPLTVATPGHFLENLVGVVPLMRTIWSPPAFAAALLYLALLIAVACALMPKSNLPVSQFPAALRMAESELAPLPAPRNYSERLEQAPWMAWVVGLVFLFWLGMHFVVKQASFTLNSLNAMLLLLVFLLHGSVRKSAQALEKSCASAWPILILYPLYAGVSGLIEHTTLGPRLAAAISSASSPFTFPLLTALVSSVFAFFIPSSGGQWVVQGLVTAKSALALGVPVERAILALGVGDHMGNLISPFWYVVVSSLAKVDFRSFFGYGVIYALIWFATGTLVFTFWPM